MTQYKETYHFIHNVFADFFKDTLDFFSDCLYPRFQYKVIGTYDKAVEYINKYCEYGRETDKPILPAIVLNPSGEFLPADGNAGGRQLWRYPNLASSMNKRLFDAIYKDQHIQVYPGFIRIKGEIELIMLLNSFYEYCDVRMLFINIFGGPDRIIYPKFFSSFIILPESFVNFNYKNPFTGADYVIDWSGANASESLVTTTNQTELVLPLNIKPQYSLASISDASNRYGGTDGIAEWKLSATINYELEIPNFLILDTDYLIQGVNFQIEYGSVYSANNDYQPPDTRMLIDFEWDWGLNYDTNTPDKLGYMNPNDCTSETTFIADYEFKTRYFHIVTAEEAALCDSTSDIRINLPEVIKDEKILLVNSKHGKLNYGDDYILDNDTTGVTVLVILTSAKTISYWNQCPPVTETVSHVCLREGWILELYVYERLP